LTELRHALAELGHSELDVELTEITTERDARERDFVGSPTLRVDGVDPLPPPAGEPAGLTCRVYRRRDGRPSPTPDPEQLREALRRLLPPPTEEV
ncbi:MAG: hypothetical protein ABR947_06820, partial [Solirubrobacteraceae bacterium]